VAFIGMKRAERDYSHIISCPRMLSWQNWWKNDISSWIISCKIGKLLDHCQPTVSAFEKYSYNFYYYDGMLTFPA
jgi:hypothetical protein